VIEEPFGNGLNERAEFSGLSDERIKEVFEFFDSDQSGSIDKTEFFLAMQKLGLPAPASEVDKMVAQYDTNGNELLEFDEFKELLGASIQRRLDNGGVDGGKMIISNSLGRILVESFRGFYMVVGMIFGVSPETTKAKQLEVLPLTRYCINIQRDILQQAVFKNNGNERQRYMSLASQLGAPGLGTGLDTEIMI